MQGVSYGARSRQYSPLLPTRSGSPLTSSIPLPVKLGAVYGLPLPAAVSASGDGAEAPFGVVAVADQVL